VVEAHAALAADRHPAAAARLLGFAATMRARQDNHHPALLQPAAHTGKHCRDALGDARFVREHRRGARLADAAPTALATLLAEATAA
jgi:hypothetical protein